MLYPCCGVTTNKCTSCSKPLSCAGMVSQLWYDKGCMEGMERNAHQPVVAIPHCYASEIGLHVLSVCTVTGMHLENSLNFWLVTLPLIMFTLVCFATDIGFWKRGPDFVNVKLYPPLLLTLAVLVLPVLYVGYLGPISAVPWNNSVLLMCVNLAAIWMYAQTGLAGNRGSPRRTKVQHREAFAARHCEYDAAVGWTDRAQCCQKFQTTGKPPSHSCIMEKY